MKKARRKERERLRKIVLRLIKARREWANSPDGYEKLGPGSPTVPGLQEYYAVLEWLKPKVGTQR